MKLLRVDGEALEEAQLAHRALEGEEEQVGTKALAHAEDAVGAKVPAQDVQLKQLLSLVLDRGERSAERRQQPARR